MAQNNNEGDYKMKMYEAQAEAIQKQEEIENKQNEIEAMKTERDELRGNIDSTVPFEGKELQILVVGGRDGMTISSDMFLLDYYAKIWKHVSIELPHEVCGHGTVILEDELYIIGGYVYLCDTSYTTYRLNKKMEWEKLANMHERIYGIEKSCISHNGCIWVIGGLSGATVLNTIEKYDPATDRWEIMKPAMKRGRGYASAGVINDKIYVCGGWNTKDYLRTVEVFDISSEVWTDLCTLPAPRTGMSIVVDGTSIVLIGGAYSKTVWKMDVEEMNGCGRKEKKEKWIHLPPLIEDDKNSSAVRIETGCILVFGGLIDDYVKSSSSVAIFSGQEWKPFTTLPKPRHGHSTVVLTPAMIDAFRPFLEE